MGQQIMVPDLDRADIDQRINLEKCLSQIDFEKQLVTLKRNYKLLNGMTTDTRGGHVLHASKKTLDSWLICIMEAGLKEK